MQFTKLVSRFTGVSLLIILLTAGGCVRTTHPVLKDDQVTTDNTLVGKWVSQDGKISGELKPGDNQQYKLTYTNEDGKTGHFLVRFGKISTKLVAELRADAFPDGTNGEAASLVLPMYTMIVVDEQKPKVMLTGISIDWFKKYTSDNPQELDVTSIGGQDLIVNGSTDQFQDFCIKHFSDAGMLGEAKAFIRPGDLPAQPAAK